MCVCVCVFYNVLFIFSNHITPERLKIIQTGKYF